MLRSGTERTRGLRGSRSQASQPSQTAAKATTSEGPNQKMPPKQYTPLANPNPLPSKLNTEIAVAQGGEVCQGWGNIKMGGEWVGW